MAVKQSRVPKLRAKALDYFGKKSDTLDDAHYILILEKVFPAHLLGPVLD